MAWQAKLLHFSCLSRLKQAPVFIVHERGNDLHPGFKEILNTGGSVFEVPSYRRTKHGDEYPPRNTAGTLWHASSLLVGHSSHLVLLDPDMIFVRPPVFPNTLSGDFCSYINFNRDFAQTAIRVFGVPPEMVAEQNQTLRCGVPYVIPIADARALAEVWLEAVDSFPPRKWENIMYAFGLAAVKLGMPVTQTRIAQTNYSQSDPLEGDLVHYCYGDESWSKRHYFTEDKTERVWELQVNAPHNTVLGEILSQIKEAREFFLSAAHGRNEHTPAYRL